MKLIQGLLGVLFFYLLFMLIQGDLLPWRHNEPDQKQSESYKRHGAGQTFPVAGQSRWNLKTQQWAAGFAFSEVARNYPNCKDMRVLNTRIKEYPYAGEKPDIVYELWEIECADHSRHTVELSKSGTILGDALGARVLK